MPADDECERDDRDPVDDLPLHRHARQGEGDHHADEEEADDEDVAELAEDAGQFLRVSSSEVSLVTRAGEGARKAGSEGDPAYRPDVGVLDFLDCKSEERSGEVLRQRERERRLTGRAPLHVVANKMREEGGHAVVGEAEEDYRARKGQYQQKSSGSEDETYTWC